VSAEDILDYAKKLSQYTSAPPHFNPAIPSSMIVYPPYPDESRMRMGLLFRQNAAERFEDGNMQFKYPYYLKIINILTFGSNIEEQSIEEEDEDDDEDEEFDHVAIDETHARSNSFGSAEIVQQTNQTEAFTLDLNPELE
jgi:hypothetical protein